VERAGRRRVSRFVTRRRCPDATDARVQGSNTRREYGRLRRTNAAIRRLLCQLRVDTGGLGRLGDLQGKIRYSYTDGHEDILSAGEAYYVRPGHVFEALEDTETVEFSPKEEFDKTLEVVGKNLEDMDHS
jgi:hypothetical protein